MAENTHAAQLAQILKDGPGTKEEKKQALFDLITALAPAAHATAESAAGGTFLAILMQLLIQFLPILLEFLRK